MTQSTLQHRKVGSVQDRELIKLYEKKKTKKLEGLEIIIVTHPKRVRKSL